MTLLAYLDGTPLVDSRSLRPLAYGGPAQVSLIGAPDSCRNTFEEVCAFPVPNEKHGTKKDGSEKLTYQPVPYRDFILFIASVMSESLDREPLAAGFATAMKGDQLFGKIVWEMDNGLGLSMVLRSSYNLTISNQVAAGGLDTFICSNGCFPSVSMVQAKHTLNVLGKIDHMVRQAVEGGRMLKDANGNPTGQRDPGPLARFQQLAARMERWAGVGMCDDYFHAFVGILEGRGTLTPHHASAARKYWVACRAAYEHGPGAGRLHAEHGAPNLANAFHAVTGGLQRARPRDAFRSFAGLDFVTERIERSGGSLDGHIPSFTLTIDEVEAVE